MKTNKLFLSLAIGSLAALTNLLASTAFGQFQYERLKSTDDSPTSIIEGSDGALYGTASNRGRNGSGTVFKVNTDGSGYTVLHTFTGSGGDGAYPRSGLVEGSDGALYGTTSEGGITNAIYPYSYGTVFKLNKDGSGYLVLRQFTGAPGDGTFPSAMIEGRDGVLYGTTAEGGITNASSSYSYGTVFKLNRDGGGYAVLRQFTGSAGDGALPSVMIEGSDGALYGVTEAGWGKVFKISKDGSSYSVLHNFTGMNGDGGFYPLIGFPHAALMEGSDGALYGMTSGHRTLLSPLDPHATVFKINKDGSGYAVLRSLGASVTFPGGLREGRDGALYGTTFEISCLDRGGCSSVGGSAFKLSKDGNGYTVLHEFELLNFDVEDGDCAEAKVRLVKGSDGGLYGTTPVDGDMGTIFALRPQPRLLPPIVSANGVLMRFTSVPGSTNRIQRVSTLGGTWLTLTNLVAPTNGVAEFTDQTAPQASAFYRVVQVR